MFTGIVRERGRVVSFDGSRLVVEAPRRRRTSATRSRSPASASPSSRDGGRLAFDVVGETLERTTLGGARGRRRGERRARAPRGRAARRPHRAGPRRRRRPLRGEVTARVWFDAPPACSATASRRARSRSTASRSPSPRSTTTASPSRSSRTRSRRRRSVRSRPATRVNLEVDVIAKYVERLTMAR